MNKIILVFTIFYLSITNVNAWFCVGNEWFLYKTKDNISYILLNDYKLYNIFTNIPIQTVNIKYERILTSCDYEVISWLEKLKLSNFSTTDILTIITNIIFLFFIFIFLPFYFIYKRNVSKNNKNLFLRYIYITLFTFSYIYILKILLTLYSNGIL